MSWASVEFKNIDLGDRCMDKRTRTVLLAERTAANPLASIPQARGGWAETQADYRFLAQNDIEWEGILTPYWRSAEARMRALPVLLCLWTPRIWISMDSSAAHRWAMAALP